jgi:MYXO-CTERM domain-containing protein
MVFRLAAVLSLMVAFPAFAERDSFNLGDGHDGALSVSTANTVINAAAPLTTSVAAGATLLKVGAASATTTGTGFAVGRLVLVIQSTGLTPEPASAGNNAPVAVDLTSNDVGHFELARVQAMGTGQLQLTAPLTQGFAATVTQVVSVPEYTTVTLTGAGTLVAPAWDGTRGGVVGFLATGAVTLATNTKISADGLGFRGGVLSNDTTYARYGCLTTDLDLATGAAGGKGEGIVVSSYSKSGRGNLGNAGGGGDCHNSGGGGGGHGGPGGLGGLSYTGDSSRPVGGIGGAALTYLLTDHLIFGGGGGAGHENDNVGTAGGAGGGIVWVRAASLAGTGKLSATGTAAGTSSNDGSGGGGAGGAIALRVQGAANCAALDVSGGKGGNAGDSHGPGGGGGGGRVLVQASGGTCPTVVGFGAPGLANGVDRSAGPVATTTTSNGNVTTPSGGFTPPAAPVITSPLNGATVGPTPAITGTGLANSTVLVVIDGVEVGSVTTDASGNWSYTPASLSAGAHALSARQLKDGVASSLTVAVNVTVDATPPDTTLTAEPQATSNTKAPSFSFVSTKPNSTFRCSLDGGAFTACTTPWPLSGLSEGSHTFQVAATDAYGNVDPTPASYTWTVDTVAPTVTITSGPSPVTNATTAALGFSSNDASATFSCSLNAGTPAPCTSPQSFTGLTDGTYTFRVVAADAAGNTSAAASYSWRVDTTPPDTSIASGPALTSPSSTASFTITSDDASASFECSLDGAAYGACPPGPTYTGLADGNHVLGVRARDAAGNVDPTPATWLWTVDTVAPDTSLTAGPKAQSNSASPTFTASSNETSVTYECSLDGASFSACPPGITLSGVTEGSHTLAVRAKDAAGNVDPTPATWSWATDLTAPSAPVVSAPAANGTTGPFTVFTGTAEAGSQVVVSVDGAPVCTATAQSDGSFTCTATTALGSGPHSATATATDPSGNTSAASTAVPFTVDAQGPDTAITSAPPAATNQTTAAFTFTSTKSGATFACSLDGAAYAPCATQASFSGLAEGAHTLAVRSTDVYGNVDATPATASWTVDLTPPDTTLSGGPSGTVGDSSATFTASSTESGVTYQCSLDGAAYATCPSPLTYTMLADGMHSLGVRAVDAAGNVDPTPATALWSVDTVVPDTAITQGPQGPVNQADASFTFSSTKSGVTYQCSLDGAAFTACPSPQAYTGLAEGPHQLLVRATDAVGHVDPTPASRAWTVDTQAPLAPVITAPLAQSTTGALPTFAGTAEPGSTVTVAEGGTNLCTTVVSATGVWSCSPATALSAGSHSVTATTSDPAGNTSAPSSATAFTVGTASTPDTTILSGPSGLTRNANATFTFGSDASGATFECSLDGAAFVACPTGGLYTGLLDGTHTLAVRAKDASGAVDPSPASRTWSIDTQAPGAPVVQAPVAGGTTGALPTASGTAEPGSTVTVSIDGSTACTAVADAAGAWACSVNPALGTGSHTLTATANDAAGNTSPASPTVTFTVDTSTPDTRIVSGPSGTVASATATFTFASDAAGASFECSLDGATFTACPTDGTYAGLSDGMHTLQVRASANGQVDATPASRSWTVDTTAPTAPTLSTPTEGATTGTLPQFAGTAEAGSRVTVFVDGVPVCETTAESTGLFACSASAPLAPGAHQATARAVDGAGNASDFSAARHFTVSAAAPNAPVITSPASGTLLATGSPVITGTAAPGSQVTVLVDGQAAGTATADAMGHWSLTPSTPMSDGAHQLTATATRDGATSTPSTAVAVTVDTTPPQVSATFEPPTLTSDGDVVISSNEAGTTYTCSLDGAAFVPCTSPYAPGALSDGNHTVVVKGTDAAGNVGTATVSFATDAASLTAARARSEASFLGGSGCGCTSTSGSEPMAAFFALALLGLFAGQRRRLQRGSALAVALVGAAASAQTAAIPGFELERLELNPGATASLVTSTGDLLPAKAWRVSLVGHYENSPLVAYSGTGSRLGAVVADRVTAHLAGAWAPLKWLELGLQVPVVVYQRGDDLSGLFVPKLTSTALGTPFLSARVAGLQQAWGDPVDLSFQVGLGLPLGSSGAFTRDPTVSVVPRVGVGRAFGWLRLGADVGALLRGGEVLSQTATIKDQVGSQLTLGGSVTTVGQGLRGELTGRLYVPFTKTQAAGEVLLGARYPLGRWLEVFAMGGPGFGRTPGTPAYRLFAGLAVQPPVGGEPVAPVCVEGQPYDVASCPLLDLDGDGIANGVDACVREKGVAVEHGCPAKVLDADHDGLDDAHDACPTEAGPADHQGCPVKDSDHDGLEDAQDACPTEPGPAERHGCPVKDSDGDGIEDALDACPAEKGVAEEKGCPVKDTDGDGVKDALDNCPTEKGDPANAGCPLKQKQLVTITKDKLVIKEKVFFATGKSQVLPRSFTLLDNVAQVLVAHPEVPVVVIEGHTDDVGPREANVKLSQSRADAVKALLEKRKVSGSRLKAVGYGPDKPTGNNATAEGREQNRRVEFTFEASSP